MNKDRLLAFSDGVLAIIITIMVLEMHAPHGANLSDLRPLVPVFLSYVLSFVYVGIYWNNHHHMMHTVNRVNGKILWANLHSLFWLSLVPFVTAWMGQNDFAPFPMAFYGVVLFMAASAYDILERQLVAHHGEDSVLSRATGKRRKEKLSVLLYLSGILLAFVQPLISLGIYMLVALIWIVPDKRIERALESRQTKL